MRIAYNPLYKPDGKTKVGALTSAPINDIVFDLPGKSIWAKGLKFLGTDSLKIIIGSSSDTVAGTWTGQHSEIGRYEDGLTIIYIPKVAGASTTTLNINGLGAKTCYYSSNSKLTTHYSAGTPILFTYYNDGWRRADYNINYYRPIEVNDVALLGNNNYTLNFKSDGNISYVTNSATNLADLTIGINIKTLKNNLGVSTTINSISTNDLLPTSKSVYDFVGTYLTSYMRWKGNTPSSGTTFTIPNIAVIGDAYRIAVAGTIPAANSITGSAQVVEVGDIIICTDATGPKYTVAQTNWTTIAGTSALVWNSEVTLATIGGLAIKAKLPVNPTLALKSISFTKADGTAVSYNGSAAVDLTGGINYATLANLVKNNLIIKWGNTEGTNLFTYNGSAAKTVNITPASIGASTSGHTHTTTIATSTDTNQIALVYGGKYKLTAGGTSYVFSMPTSDNTWRPIGTGATDAAAGNHTHDGRYLRWNGSAANVAAMTWGTLTSANGYTILSHAASSDGGDMGFVNKGGKIFMLLDGHYYLNEGKYRVLDTSDFTVFSNAGSLTTRITIGGVTKDLKIDADKLDGIDSTGFLRYYNSNAAPSNVNIVNTPSYVWTVSTTGGSVTTVTKPSGIDNAWGVIHLHTHIGNFATQLGFGGTTNRMYMRNAYDTSTFGNWQTLAFTSDIPTALKNPYTLTFSAGIFATKTYDGSSAITVNIPTHTSHLINNSGFLTLHLSLANYVTLNTALTITNYKIFRMNAPENDRETVYYNIGLKLSSYGDHHKKVAAIGMGNEPNGWYKAAIGFERTGSYDRGDIVFLFNNTINNTTCTYSDIKVRINAAGNINTLGIVSASGFTKTNSSDSYILLGAGGHKAISDFATSGHNHDGRYVYNYGGTQMDGASINKNALGMTTSSGITGDWWHILQAAWNGEYRWNSLIAFPTLNRNGIYYRSGLDNNTAWGAWVKLLDINNYSSILDSRYYTESEVNNLLANYYPITGGNMSGDNRWIGSTMGGGSDYWRIGGRGSDDIGTCIITIGDNYNDKFAVEIADYQGSIYRPLEVIYAGINTLNIYVEGTYKLLYSNSANGSVIHSILNYNLSPYGLLTRIYNSGCVSLQSQRESSNSEVFSLSLNPLGGNVGIGTTNPTYKLHVAGDIYTTTGFKKNGSSDSYVLLGGGGHKAWGNSSENISVNNGTICTNLNADMLDNYHLDDILPYGLENLCVGAVASGGQTTLNSDGSITTSGTNSDTYFFVRSTENLIAGLIYTVGFYVTGVPSGNTATWSWPFAGQGNNKLVINIKSNGWCWGTGTIPKDIVAGTNIILDDSYRGFWDSINISKFVIVKGRQKAYYTPPISKMSVNYANSAGNADTVDGYHASSLWRSDGATWNPGANVSLNASANGQEWSFDIRRNGYTGCYWHVWDSSLSTMLRVNADNGKVYAPYNFVGNLEGNSSTATNTQNIRIDQYASTGKYPIIWADSASSNANSNTISRLYKTWKYLYWTPNKKTLTLAGNGTKCAIGSAFDTADRPGLHITGNYPELIMMSLNVSNAHHGSTIVLGAYNSSSDSETNYRAFAIGMSGTTTNEAFLDFGYGANMPNPHSNGINNYGNGSFNNPYIMRLAASKRVFMQGIGYDSLPVLLVSASRNGRWSYAAAFMAPNTGTGNNVYVPIGKTMSTRNCFGFTHEHAGGDGSAANYGAVEVFGVGNVLRWYYDKHSEFIGRLDTANRGNSADYMNSALLIREYNCGGALSDTWGNAPRLSWHWSGRVQTQIGLASNNELYLSKDLFSNAYKLVYETGTWGISITGNANSATNADKVDGYHASSLITWKDMVSGRGALTWSEEKSGVTIYSHYTGHGLGSYRAVLACKAPSNSAGLEINAYWCVNPSDSAAANNIYYRVKRDAASDWGPYTKLLLSDGNATITGSYYANSDIRYKSIQTYLLNKVNSIAELPIFTYYWKDNLHDDKLHIGSSAQAVIEIFPELVTYDESKDFYNLDYATLGTIAGITACKELVTLKSELQELKEKVKLLEDKLRKYENTL